MAIIIPSLDDRSYEQLVEVLRRQIPPEEWTDHNASDPGIMLIELLCWLGEMALYQMGRVPESHEAKFLNFLIDPPEPVTVEAQFEVTFDVPSATPPVPATTSLTIPAGTLLATDFVNGRRFVFETFEPLVLNRPDPPLMPVGQGSTRARAILEVFDEPLGHGDGSAHQTFELRPPRQALGITDPDTPAPILTDFVHRTAGYEPNPQVRVGTDIWPAVPSLRTPHSRGGAQHCMIEHYEQRVRFGDGDFGEIPAVGVEIVCTRYAVLDGPAALTVGRDDVRHILRMPGVAVPDDVTLAVGNTEPEGGANFFPMNRRLTEGLRAFRAPHRLITERDFEDAVLRDFNALLRQSVIAPAVAPQIARASVVFNRRPPLTDDIEAPGHLTFVLLAIPPFDEAVFQDESLAVAPLKEPMVVFPPALWLRLRRFLDSRRLITTRLHHDNPSLRAFTATATVIVAADRNVGEMRAALRTRMYEFLSLLSGDVNGRGWRLGRSVYRSQLFRLLEDTDGVDHVASLSLSPADAHGNVQLQPHELPLLQTLMLTVVRA